MKPREVIRRIEELLKHYPELEEQDVLVECENTDGAVIEGFVFLIERSLPEFGVPEDCLHVRIIGDDEIPI